MYDGQALRDVLPSLPFGPAFREVRGEAQNDTWLCALQAMCRRAMGGMPPDGWTEWFGTDDPPTSITQGDITPSSRDSAQVIDVQTDLTLRFPGIGQEEMKDRLQHMFPAYMAPAADGTIAKPEGNKGRKR